ncbi:MAG: dihydrofolate reductase [Candidatus Marinimicrobia bacterium]|jgi:dihydrofolate reductase|nr:dihydrofolate reductase [Candidatus Neomarinimicrobiota bacterium]MDP7654129.1 dihydrofolate reductase [Candidatus Neomarinimicrobiota bacterium]|tara:strand:+ start:1112 stop:1561 length:450 start_codon:yes stop_codon:yes gene_type:complete
MDVILIAAVTANGMIARNSDEVVGWSEDLSLFLEQTMGHAVIMGTNTENTLSADLKGREMIVVHREMKPENVLNQIDAVKCFVIGGARTYSRFAPYLTHLFLTPHPIVMKSGSLPLFSHLKQELELDFLRMIEVNGERGIYQYQYRVKQ